MRDDSNAQQRTHETITVFSWFRSCILANQPGPAKVKSGYSSVPVISFYLFQFSFMFHLHSAKSHHMPLHIVRFMTYNVDYKISVQTTQKHECNNCQGQVQGQHQQEFWFLSLHFSFHSQAKSILARTVNNTCWWTPPSGLIPEVSFCMTVQLSPLENVWL